MAEAATEVTLQYPGAEPTVCLCHPRQGWDAVKCLGNKPIVVRGTWLHALHQLCHLQNKAAVVVTEEGDEILLVPLFGKGSVPILAGYQMIMGAGDALIGCLASRQLPLVFDLDETLLVAKSQSQLQRDLQELQQSRRPEAVRALESPGADPEAARAGLLLLDREAELIARDLDLLEQYSRTDGVAYGSGRLTATLEPAVDERGEAIERPVLRLPDREGVLFTRINPASSATSMVFHVRPGWGALRPAILDRAAFRTYVCTAARPEYAMEAWRVLDPGDRLVALDERGARISCMAKKNLAGVVVRHRGASLGDASVMPLAAIVDDRTDVWDPANRAQVIQVEPFKPYEERAAAELGLRDRPTLASLDAQMEWLRAELRRLHAAAFEHIDAVLRRLCHEVGTGARQLDPGAPVASYDAILPKPVWIADLIQKAPKYRASTASEEATAPASLAAAIPALAAALLPQDPRQRRGGEAGPENLPTREMKRARLSSDVGEADGLARPNGPMQSAAALAQPAAALTQPLDPALLQTLLDISRRVGVAGPTPGSAAVAPVAMAGRPAPAAWAADPPAAFAAGEGPRPAPQIAGPRPPPPRRRPPPSPPRGPTGPPAVSMEPAPVAAHSAVQELYVAFPKSTNNLVWQDLAPTREGQVGECRVRLTVNGNEFVAEASSDRGFKPAKQRAALMVLEQAGYRVDYATIAQPNAFAKPRGRGGGRVGGRGGRGRGIPDRI